MYLLRMHTWRTPLPMLMVLTMMLAIPGCDDDTPTAPDTTGVISGQVLAVDDSGIENALLTLAAEGEPTRTVTSAPDGGFSIEGVEPGTYTLTVEAPTGWVKAPAESGTRNLTVTAGGMTAATFRLAPAEGQGTLSGWVFHDGRGVGEVRVILRGPGGEEHEVFTDEDGSFDFPGLAPGGRELEIQPPAWFVLATGEPVSRLVTVPSFGRTHVEIELLPYTAQETVEVRIEPTLNFVPDDITVAPGTRIMWVNSDVENHTITPDDDGAWERREVSQEEEVFEATLNNPGVYTYRCEFHGAGGMTGVIRVQP